MIRETEEQREAVRPIWFKDQGDFQAVKRAERFLADRGFSVGHTERGSPRGILYGDFDIQKWRNLRPAHRAALHGEMTGDYRNGPVAIWIRRDAPAEAVAALLHEARA